jgi:hypothetical protein
MFIIMFSRVSTLLFYWSLNISFDNARVYLLVFNHIGGVMVSVLTSNAVDRGFEPQSGQTKDYKIDICGFSA